MRKEQWFLDLDVEKAISLLGNAFLRGSKSSTRQKIKKHKEDPNWYKNELIRIFFRVVLRC